MEDRRAREARFAKINRVFYGVYAACAVAGLIFNFAIGELFYGVMSPGTLLWFPVMWAVYKFLPAPRSHQMEFVITAFIFLSYSLGVNFHFYWWIPGYDKLMHTLSGTLTMFLALPFFYELKPGHAIEPRDFPLAAVFCLMTALAVAGLWEICEYTLSLLTGIDVQNAAATGVSDTMQDMIVCLLGAVCFLPLMRRFYRRGRAGVLMGAIDSYVAGRRRGG